MSDKAVLSQEEIDALLSDDSEDGPEETGASTVRPYDLTQRIGPKHGRLPILEIIGERFARSLSKSLQNLFRYSVDVGAGGVESLSFSDYGNRLNVPSSISIVELAPVAGQCLFVLDAPLIHNLIDRYFGGMITEQGIERSANEFTPTERRVVTKVKDLVGIDLCAAWQDILPLQVRCLADESNPHLINVYAQDDELLLLSYPISFDGGTGELHLVLPQSGLAPFLERLGASGQTDTEFQHPQWQTYLENHLLDTVVDLNCLVATADVRLSDLLNMAPGDVLNVDMPQRHELCVQGAPVVRGRLKDAAGKLVLEAL